MLPRPNRPAPLLFYYHSLCRAGDLWATGKLSTDPQLGLWALWVTGMLSTSSFIPSFLYHAEHFCEGTMFEEHFAEALHEGT